MSILDEYNILEGRLDKTALLNVFQKVEYYNIPAAMKAWVDMLYDILPNTSISNADKATVVELCRECGFNYRIYLRNLRSSKPAVTIVETFIGNNRTDSFLKSWIDYILSLDNPNKHENELTVQNIDDLVNGFMGSMAWYAEGDASATLKSEIWRSSYEVVTIPQKVTTHSALAGYQIEYVEHSNYDYYIDAIQQLLDIYNIKKES